MRTVRALAAALVVTGILVGGPHGASGADAPTMTEFDQMRPSSSPMDITLGPDGRTWFTQATGVGAITPTGTVTNYDLPPSRPEWIEAGSDGALWVSGPDLIRRVTTDGQVTTFDLPPGDPTWGDSIGGLALGPDGNIWYTRWPGTVGKITPSGEVAEYPIPLDEPTQSVMPGHLTVGPDGALWFNETWNARVGRVTTDGAFTMFPLPPEREAGSDIAVGPDGNLWLGFSGASRIGRLTTSGEYTEIPGPSSPSFATAADGRLWYGSLFGIGTIDVDGTVTDHGGSALNLTPGAGGTLWYTTQHNSIGRIDVEPDPRGEFTPVTPARILDTRSGLGRPGSVARPVGPRESITVQVAGRGDVPATGASAVVLNVTVTSPTAPGWLAVYPAGNTVPTVSNLNFTPGSTVANMVTVALGDGGRLAAFNAAGQSEVMFDVVGYYADADGPLGARFVGTAPQRAFDTRTGAGGVRPRPLGPGGSLRFKVTGIAGVPASGVTSVVINLTGTAPTSPTWLAVYPDDVARPSTSSLNLPAGTTVPNLVTVRVPPSGVIDVYNATGSTHVIGDVMGYYTTQVVTNEGRFIPVSPQRVFDSRVGDFSRNGVPLPGGVTTISKLDGNPQIDRTGAAAAVLNLTVTQPDAGGWLSAFPGDDCTYPSSSNLNFAAGQTIPNSVITRLATRWACDGHGPGSFAITTTSSTHLIVDLFGYFTTRSYAFDGD